MDDARPLRREDTVVRERRQPLAPTAHSGAAATTASVRRVLFVVGEGHLGIYPLVDGKTLTIGRDPDADVSLAHAKISRYHARVHAGDTIAVEDLGSTNGTRVAGRRIEPSQRIDLELGTNLGLGPYVAVVLSTTGEAAAGQPLPAAIPISDPTPSGVPEVVARVAKGMVSVLIAGETGVGKEVLARTIHELSGRKGQFVAINCASLSEALLESELFGHEAGAFTGATSAKPGLFELASGGTVLLDEIGELPAGLQAKLLRVLETRSVYRVGGVKPVTLEIRFIAATHRTLTDDVASGRFRQDLYFRVNGIAMAIAPLRARRDAIPGLAAAFLAAATPRGRSLRLTTAALAVLVQHDWPGNVRELRSAMERSAVICDGDEIGDAHLLLDATPAQRTARVASAGASTGPRAADDTDERARILAALEACAGNQTRAARQLGLSRTTFVSKLALHGIRRPRG